MFLPAVRQVGANDIPAVGCAFGFDRILDAMEEQSLFPPVLPGGTKALITVFTPELSGESLRICSTLRENGIAADVTLDPDAKMEKQLKFANQKNIPYVLIIGPEEKEKNLVTLKNMGTREQKQVTPEELIKILQSS